MANKITTEQIAQINDLYYQYKVYAKVAREMGISAGTVKRYVDPNYAPYDSSNERHFTFEMLPPIGSGLDLFKGVDNYGSLCIMSSTEFDEVRAMKKELH